MSAVHFNLRVMVANMTRFEATRRSRMGFFKTKLHRGIHRCVFKSPCEQISKALLGYMPVKPELYACNIRESLTSID